MGCFFSMCLQKNRHLAEKSITKECLSIGFTPLPIDSAGS